MSRSLQKEPQSSSKRGVSVGPIQQKAPVYQGTNSNNKSLSEVEACKSIFDTTLFFAGSSGSGKSSYLTSLINIFEKRDLQNITIASSNDSESPTEPRFMSNHTANTGIPTTTSIKYFQAICPHTSKKYLLIYF